MTWLIPSLRLKKKQRRIETCVSQTFAFNWNTLLICFLNLSKSGWEPSCPKTPKSRRHLRLPACTQDLTWHTSDNSELHCIYQFCVPVHTWLCQRRDNEHCFLGGVLWDSRQSGGSLHPKSFGERFEIKFHTYSKHFGCVIFWYVSILQNIPLMNKGF